jgi:hypothetical protein
MMLDNRDASQHSDYQACLAILNGFTPQNNLFLN